MNSESYSEWNLFVRMDDKTENEYYDPYVFPAIMEKETETEQTSSFSVWQTDEVLKESETSATNTEFKALNPVETVSQPSGAAKLLRDQLSGDSMEHLIDALAQALQIRNAEKQEKKAAKLAEPIYQILKQREKLCQETEEFYHQLDEENVKQETCSKADVPEKEKTEGTSVKCEEIPYISRAERKVLRRLEQRTKLTIPIYGKVNLMGEKEKLAMLLTETHSNRDFYDAIVTMDPCFGYDSDASPALAIFKATGQACHSQIWLCTLCKRS